jgi:multidrug resistance efflux pump
MRTLRPVWTVIALLGVLALGAAPLGCGLHGKPTVARKERSAAPESQARSAAPKSDDEKEKGKLAARPEAPKAPQERVEADQVVAPGIVEPWGDPIELSAQESGWIEAIQIAEGHAVERGQVLAQLEDSSQRHGLELARAEVDDAAAALAKLENGATAEELQQARAQRDAAVVRQRLARSEAARSAQLHESGAAPDADADKATAEAQSSAALAEVAEARVRELERGARAEDRAGARARLAAAKARLALAEAALARRKVLAPGRSTVLLSRFHAGEFYDSSRGPLFTLGDVSRLQVRLEVDEIDALAIEPGAHAALYSDAGDLLGRGTVVRLAPKMGRRALPIESPTARADVRVREVFVEVPATPRLLSGQRVWGHADRRPPGELQAREDAGSSARSGAGSP